MPKVSIVSLGCPKNLVDSETLLGNLGKEGFENTPNAEDAELVLVNTCGFIEEAKRESIEEILKLRHLRGEGKKLLVFGCLAKRYGNELMKEIPEIDALWGVGEEEKIVDYCKKAVGSKQPLVDDQGNNDKRGPMPGKANLERGSYAYLKIAEGCSRGCTYCVIPDIRGPYRSTEPEKILRKAEEHIASGIRELVLIAQDIGSYGREFGGYTLVSLLKDMASITGDFWIRLLYLYPTAINEELLSLISHEHKICKYLDVPLQHSEDRILRAMGRTGTKESYSDMIRRIRDEVPGAALRTTFIVGFPGETGDEYQGLKTFIEETRFERLGVFVYSKEEGTPAAGMKGNVPRKVKEERRDEIMRVQSRISLDINKTLVGQRFRVLVDETDGDTIIGRLSSQAPEIDGVVIIEKKDKAMSTVHGASGRKKDKNASRLTLDPSRLLRAGEFVEVKIKEAYDYDLKGELVE
ncbi:MAG TPA: 30S ribosomal protein S12 methylthiotransferase RimO [Thermodesulfovibrionales bacterium]|nr:30S ribosomal protein S12 methylthiotransferase RimO [Thermodesulfovibrionales bacterium]